VTVTNNVSRKPVKELNYNQVGTVFVLNVAIALMAGILIIYYVVQANIIAASSYKIIILNEKLDSLNESRASLASQKTAMEDPAKILNFAVSQNMIEVKNAVYIFENGSVALRP